ncbi:lipoprotein [Streptomyces glaucosporus]|uniref:Lipoprotein n=1 Tax=Streptomyces glaucosporus TaxID=284044 RepID=A0ABN3I5X9_9ACTN
MTTARRTVRTVAAVLAALAIGGCGIRSTPVPVDAGPAPSRASCTPPAPDGERAGGGTVLAVFLVCGGEVIAVERAVPLEEPPGEETGRDARLRTARALLEELREAPSRAEDEAGFGSAVPGDLEVGGPSGGDPKEALRLDRDPGGLPPFALAQVVCTFAGTAATGRDGTVTLGGPARDGDGGGLLEYSCTRALRGDPEAARTAGTPLPE